MTTNYKTSVQNLIEKGATVEQINNKIKEFNQEIYNEHCKTLAKKDNVFQAIFNNDIVN